MAGQWVDDPSWGHVFDGFFSDSSGKVGQAQLAAEHIKALQLKRAQDTEQLQAIRALIDRQNAQYNNMAPPPTDIPMPPNFDFGSGGAPGAVPFTPGAGGMGTTVTPAEPLRLSNVPRSWGLDEPFYRNREEARAVANLGPYLAKSPEALIKGNTGSSALAQLKLYGIPPDQPSRDILGTQLGMVDAKLPGMTGAASPAAHNYTYTDPATGQQRVGRTIDSRTDVATGKPLPPDAAMAGPYPIEHPKDPLGSHESAIAAVMNGPLAQKVQRHEDITPDEARQLGNLLDRAYPEKLVSNEENGRKVWRTERGVPIPEGLQRVVELVNAFRGNAHTLPPQPLLPTGLGVPYLPNAGVVPPAMETTFPPPPEPIVPGQRPITNAPSEPVATGPINAMSLADNLRGEPVYKTYQTVIQAWNTLARYAEGGHDGKFDNGTDLAIIYHIAKLFDPDSAVREGELKLAQNVGPIADTLVAMYRQKFLDGGTLPANARAQLLHAGERKMQEVKDLADSIFGTYAERAERGGVNPADVIPRLPPPRPLDYAGVVARGRETEATQPSPTPQQPTAPNQPPGVIRRPGTDQPRF